MGKKKVGKKGRGRLIGIFMAHTIELLEAKENQRKIKDIITQN